MNKFKGITWAVALTLTAVCMTACGGTTESSKPQAGQEATSSDNLPVDATKENVDYAQTTVVTEAVSLTSREETTTTTEITTEPTESTTDDSSKSDSKKPNGGGSGSGSSGGGGSIDYDAGSATFSKLKLRTFSVYGGNADIYDDYKFTSENTKWTNKESLLDKLNRHGNFAEISGETYSGGGLDECLDFNGQAYWLRGEGNSKFYVESDSEGNISAIAFSDLKEAEYAIKLGEAPVLITEDTSTMNELFNKWGNPQQPPVEYNYGSGVLTFAGDGYWCVVFDVDTESTKERNFDDYIRGIMICRRDRITGYAN
jgi:hypothetical protein